MAEEETTTELQVVGEGAASDAPTQLPGGIEPPYLVFKDRRYPWVEEFSNREMLHVTGLLAREGIDVGDGLPSWAMLIARVYVAARRTGDPLTMDAILDGKMIQFVGPPEQEESNRPPVRNGASAPTRARTGRRGSGSRST